MILLLLWPHCNKIMLGKVLHWCPAWGPEKLQFQLTSTFLFNRYASYAGQPSQTYGQSAQVRVDIVIF